MTDKTETTSQQRA